YGRAVRNAPGGIGATPFLMAAANHDLNIMRILLAAGADPLKATKENLTPLMAAAGVDRQEAFPELEEKEALEAVKLTFELGGDVNTAKSSGLTALHGATNMYAETIMEFLAGHGANLDAKDKY